MSHAFMKHWRRFEIIKILLLYWIKPVAHSCDFLLLCLLLPQKPTYVHGKRAAGKNFSEQRKDPKMTVYLSEFGQWAQ